MKYLGIYCSILNLIIGVVIGANLFEGEIKEVKTVEYVTKWKVPKKDATFKTAIGCLNSPLIINHNIDKSTIFVHAFDNCKENKKEITLKCSSTPEWNMYFSIGAVGILAGSLGTFYLLHK